MTGWLFWLGVIGAALLGVVTHIVKKMVEEKMATGAAPGFRAYMDGHALELTLMFLSVAGALFIAALLNELTIYAAYLTGFAGDAVAGSTGARARAFMSRAGQPPDS